MTWSIIIVLAAIYIGSGAIGTWYLWAAYAENYKKYRIRTPQVDRITVAQRIKVIPLNMTFSVALIAGALFFWGDRWIHHDGTSVLTVFGETFGILLVYDFFYYWAHRAMHIPKVMRLVHAVHHKARFPTAWDGLYLNPIENFLGLATLFVAIALFAPISVVSFLLIIFIHTLSNIIVHTNMVLPHPVFKLFNYWALQHDVHHGVSLTENYCNIFPYWDMLFGTYRKGVGNTTTGA